MSLYDHLIAEGEKRGEARGFAKGKARGEARGFAKGKARGEKRGTISAIHAVQGVLGLRLTSEKSLLSKSLDELVAMRDLLFARHYAAVR